MRSPGLVLLLFFLIATPTSAQQSPSEQQSAPPSIQVSVDRVNVGVIVTDPQGNFIPDLRRENFHIFDDGFEQPITDFANVIAPAEVLLLVEAGPAVYFLASTHVQASHAFLDGLSPGDRIAVAKYDAAPQLMLDFTTDKPAAYAALSNVRYYVGFGSLNLSKSLNTVLDWLAKTQGKKTIVLLSTGFDTSTPFEIDATLSHLKISDVRLLAISLSGAMRVPAEPAKGKKKKKDKSTDEEKEEAQKLAAKSAFAQQGFDEADRLLRALTDATGGQVYFPNNPRDYSRMYAQIAQLIRHEYSLAFAPSTHDGKVHSIEVRVTPPNSPPQSTSSSTDSTSTQPALPAPTYKISNRRAYVAPTQ